MVNKKGYVKTLEAIIAIIIVIMVSYFTVPKNIDTAPETPIKLKDAMGFINKNLEFNETIRYKVVSNLLNSGVEEDIEGVIKGTKPKDYDFVCAICSSTDNCIITTPLEKDIFVNDLIIGSSGKKQNPRIIRIWFWKGPTKESELNCYTSCFNKCLLK